MPPLSFAACVLSDREEIVSLDDQCAMHTAATKRRNLPNRSCCLLIQGMIVALLFSSALLFLAGESRAQPFWQGPVIDEVQIGVPYHRQDTLVWCWVASAKMVVESLGEDAPSQCEMLQQVYGAPCCSHPWLCAKGGYITEIQNLIATFGFSLTEISTFGDGFQIFDILEKTGAPIVAYVDGSHFVVITGMKVVPSQLGPWGIARIHDPIRGRFDQDWPTLASRLGAILYVD